MNLKNSERVVLSDESEGNTEVKVISLFHIVVASLITIYGFICIYHGYGDMSRVISWLEYYKSNLSDLFLNQASDNLKDAALSLLYGVFRLSFGIVFIYSGLQGLSNFCLSR